MSDEKWHGILRSEIPWYPMIDYGKCVNCGKWVEYCKLGTFAFEGENKQRRPAVKSPNNGVVLCAGCDSICPVGAITHQSRRETREIIKNLRKTAAVAVNKRGVKVQAHE